MQLLIIIALIIVLVAEYNENQKKKQRKIVRYDTQTGAPIYEGDVIIGYNTQTGHPIYGQKIEQKPKEQKELTAEDKKNISNTILMITGAFLVVFASMIFLVSSWNNVPNIVKTLILIFVQVMFMLFAYICDNKLNIPKVGKVFKVLYFLFMPIVLISLATFEILGEEVSIEGEYFSLYVGLSFIVSDIAFKLYDFFKKDMVIKKTSYFVELLGVIFLSDQFFGEVSHALLFISLYNIIMYVLLHGNFLDKEAYQKSNNIVSYCMVGLLILSTFSSTDYVYNIALVLYTVLFFVEYFIQQEEIPKKKNLILFFITYFVSLSVIKNFDISPYFLYMIALIPIILLAKFNASANIKDLLTTLITIFIVGILIFGIDNRVESIPALLMYVFGCVDCILAFALLEKKYFKVGAYITFTLMIFEMLSILEISYVAKYALLVIIPMIYLLEAGFEKLKDNTSEIVIIGGLSMEAFLLWNNYAMLIAAALLYAYLKLENKNEEWMLFPMIFSTSLLSIEDEVLHIIIGILLMILYTALSVSKKKTTSITIVSLLFVFIGTLILEFDAYYLFGATLIWSIAHYIPNKVLFNYEKNGLYKIVIILSLLGLYIKTLVEFDVRYYSMLMLGLYLTIIAITKLVIKNDSTETKIMEYLFFLLVSASALFFITDLVDSIILITIMFILIIYTFIRKYKSYTYCSIISLIAFVIHATWEFWTKLPWYFYILLIGLALIIFAMFDEKIKQKNK